MAIKLFSLSPFLPPAIQKGEWFGNELNFQRCIVECLFFMAGSVSPVCRAGTLVTSLQTRLNSPLFRALAIFTFVFSITTDLVNENYISLVFNETKQLYVEGCLAFACVHSSFVIIEVTESKLVWECLLKSWKWSAFASIIDVIYSDVYTVLCVPCRFAHLYFSHWSWKKYYPFFFYYYSEQGKRHTTN